MKAEELIREIADGLDKKAEQWRLTQNDPYQISVAVYVTLSEIAAEMRRVSYEQPPTPVEPRTE